MSYNRLCFLLHSTTGTYANLGFVCIEEASNTAASKRSLFGESTPKTAGNAFNDSFPMAFDASPTTPEKLPKAKRQKTNSTSSPKIG